jgi:hypothetical protein
MPFQGDDDVSTTSDLKGHSPLSQDATEIDPQNPDPENEPEGSQISSEFEPQVSYPEISDSILTDPETEPESDPEKDDQKSDLESEHSMCIETFVPVLESETLVPILEPGPPAILHPEPEPEISDPIIESENSDLLSDRPEFEDFDDLGDLELFQDPEEEEASFDSSVFRKRYSVKECFVALKPLESPVESPKDPPIQSLLEQIQICSSDDEIAENSAPVDQQDVLNDNLSIAVHRICPNCPKSVSTA